MGRESVVDGDVGGGDAELAQAGGRVRCTRTDQHGLEGLARRLGVAARQRERLPRDVVGDAAGMFDQDEDAHKRPAPRSISTTAGAASGPWPRISACLPWPSGTTSRTFSSPAAARSGVRVSSGFRFARMRPGTDG